MTTLLLIRHGETDYVRNGKMAGRLPGVPLNEKGRKQAEGVALALSKAPIKVIYSSPIERAQETAAYLSKLLNLPILEAPGITETDIGEWTGRTVKQCARTKLWRLVVNKPSQLTFPGGESFAGIQLRAVAELKSIAERHPEDLVACFTHADIIRLVTAYFLDMPLDSFQRLGAEPCSVTVLNIGKDGRVSMPKINQTINFVWPEEKKKPERKNGSKPAAAS
jgi:probable phosphomutase (TIGR03848 family)